MNVYAFTTLLGLTAAQSVFQIPGSPPNTRISPALIEAPVGISFEFFAFPAWMATTATKNCLGNLAALTGTYPPIRIGGTTQDRALYDPNLNEAVNYTVSSPLSAPATLTYGPQFFKIADQLTGRVTIGLNRQLDNLYNTITSALTATTKVKHLFALEFGNEPDLFGASSPIAKDEESGVWTPTTDALSQTYWQRQVGLALSPNPNQVPNVNTTPFAQAGVRLSENGSPTGWTVSQLVPYEESTGSLQYVRTFGEHAYPQSACGGAPTYLNTLMSHTSIASFLAPYFVDIPSATNVSRPYIISETNSATCGGGGISSAFGAALWIIDYVFQGLVGGVESFNFHHGTVGDSPYDWWGYNFTTSSNLTYATYYGAYFATAALAKGARVAQLDNGTDAYAAYVVYSAKDVPMTAVLYNSDYYDNNVENTTRTAQTFQLTGLTGKKVSAMRLTAPAATSKVEFGENPSFGGLMFDNDTCEAMGQQVAEVYTVSGGMVVVSVMASEALLVTF